MTGALVLRPGRATLADWRAIYRGAPFQLDPVARADVEAAAAAVQSILARGDALGARDDDDPGPTIVEMLNKGGEYAPGALVRLALALKLASLAQGVSGVSWRLVETLAACISHDLLPAVPAQRVTDRLAFSHLAGVLTGAGEVGSGQKRLPAAKALKNAGLEPLRLSLVEKRAILSGTQLSTALALAGLFEAERVFQSALVTGALSAHSGGQVQAVIHPRIQQLHRRRGEAEVSAALAALSPGAQSGVGEEATTGRTRADFARAIPRMGACLDLLRQAGETLGREANVASEHRLVLWQTEEVVEVVEDTSSISLAADLIAVALREIGAVCQGRIVALARHGELDVENQDAGESGPIAMAAGFVAENRERACPSASAHEGGDEAPAAPNGIRRLLPMAGTAALVVALEALSSRRMDEEVREASSGPLEQVLRLLGTSRQGAGGNGRVGAADLAGAAELVRSGALADSAGPLPSVVGGNSGRASPHLEASPKRK